MYKKKREKITRVLAAIASLSVVMSFTGCGKSAEKFDVAVIVKGQESEYWDIVKKGAMDCGEELGVNVTFEAPLKETMVNEEIDLVKNAISRGVDAIVLAPSDSQSFNDVIATADKAGIAVLTIDTAASAEQIKSTIATDNRVGGVIAARAALDEVGKEGEIAVIGHQESAQTCKDRLESFVDYVEETSDIKVADIQYCDVDAQKAKEIALEYIDKYPDLKVIYATNGTSTDGACEAVKERDLTNTVDIIGFDCSSYSVEYIESGVLDGTVVQNPYNMGYIGVRYVKKIIQGESVDRSLNTGATLVTANNLNDDDIKILVNPLAQ